MNDELKLRKGIVKLNDNVETPLLKALFANFFPVECEEIHGIANVPGVTMMRKFTGFSEHFRVLEDGEQLPEYTAWFRQITEEVAVFDRLEEQSVINIVL